MSKWYGISHEGDMYSLGNCKDLQEANEVVDDMGIDIASLIDEKRAKAWAEFIIKTLNDEEYDD
jgi:hypothetical protein